MYSYFYDFDNFVLSIGFADKCEELNLSYRHFELMLEVILVRYIIQIFRVFSR